MSWAPWFLLAQSILVPADEHLRQASELPEEDRERQRRIVIETASQPHSVERLHDLKTDLWNLSLGDMPTVLQHADQIRNRAMRIEFSRHYGMQHPDPYLRERRPGQAALAGILLLAAAATAFVRRFRRSAMLAGGSFAFWLFYTLTSSDVGEFPPGSLRLLTVGFLSFIAAALICIAFTRLPQPARMASRVGRILLTAVAAALLAAVIVGWTRNSEIYPILDSGWSAMLHPFGAALLAGFAAASLAAADQIFVRLASRNELNYVSD